jgi:hypothetical protein
VVAGLNALCVKILEVEAENLARSRDNILLHSAKYFLLAAPVAKLFMAIRARLPYSLSKARTTKTLERSRRR